MGGVYRIQTFLDFYIFFIFTRLLSAARARRSYFDDENI